METRELSDVTISRMSVSSMENNVYLLRSTSTGAQVLIDAADDAGAISSLIGDAGIEAVLTTHCHWDHVRALAAVSKEAKRANPGFRSVAGIDDAEAIEEESGGVVDETVEHGQVLSFPGFDLECIALRGHTPGSIAYVLRDSSGTVVIFSGDSLFPGGPGKTWHPEDFESLMQDLEDRVFDEFDDATYVLPGHGAATMLGTERPHLDEWRARGW